MRERNFAYAVGRIRSLETGLLDNTQLERLSETANLSEALAKLGETEYAAGLAGLKQPSQFEVALNHELLRVANLITELSGNAPEFQVFRQRYDWQNLKVALKRPEVAPTELSRLGIWEPEWLLEQVGLAERAELPVRFKQAIGEARAAFQTSGDGQEIDRILDRHAFDWGYQILQPGISSLVFGWWVALIDLTNFRTFVRLRIIGMTAAFLPQFWIGGGALALDSFKELWDQPDEKVALWLENTRYAKVLPEGLQTLTSLSKLEREFDNYLINLIAPAKMIPLGIEPLIGYWLAKEHEVKILRIILVGKSNQAANVEIKERLRRAYA